MRALVLDDRDPQSKGRVLVSEGWATPEYSVGSFSFAVPKVGDEVWVTNDRGILRYRKIKEGE